MQAQDTEINDYSNLKPEDCTNITLPPLHVLFENAKQSAVYELAAVKEKVEQRLLKKEKRAWLGFFSIRGSYQYGMLGNDASYSDIITPVVKTYTTQAQKSYTVGGGVSIPLDDLFDLQARVRRQKLNVRSAELEKKAKFDELKREIIILYTTATAQSNILKLRAEALILSNAQYAITEKKFSNGTVDSSTLSVEKERQSNTLESFEKTKFELIKNLMTLELITHTPILK
ncbi:TolC family protein [uncultured Bacteroides sp.]|uniref:TolC family protein n=1 Tax=uncultured Bacteroides sp. TaxID=162156 RepID=UPI002AAB48DD|nr:TolC family protein [uncultured Bacteroides sp.]